jgi:hypothetical protein
MTCKREKRDNYSVSISSETDVPRIIMLNVHILVSIERAVVGRTGLHRENQF